MSKARSATREDRLRQNSAKRRAERKLNLRQAILDAATELFERDGFEGFSMRQVAEEINYSPTTIYLHFKDKDDLLFHVALEGFRTFGQDLQAGYDRGSTAIERLRETGRAYLQFGLRHPLHYRLMFMVRGEYLERPCPSGYANIIDSFGVLERIVREGVASGELPARDPQVYTTLMWSNVHGLVSLHLATPYFPTEMLEGLFDQHMEVMTQGLRS